MGTNNKFYTVHRAKDFSDVLEDLIGLSTKKVM